MSVTETKDDICGAYPWPTAEEKKALHLRCCKPKGHEWDHRAFDGLTWPQKDELHQHKIKVTYTNHRGETARRTITPLKLRWGHSDHHHVDQWLLECFDHDKNADRTYALDDCDFTVPS